MLKVEVRSRIVGMPATEAAPSNVVLDLLNEKLSVADLIAHTVEEQIRDLLINRKMDAGQAERILNRQYLTDTEVQQQAEKGVIRKPAAKDASLPTIDTRSEIKKALRAFEQKTYLIVADGNQLESLDEIVELTPRSRVTFVRMTPLVGG